MMRLVLAIGLAVLSAVLFVAFVVTCASFTVQVPNSATCRFVYDFQTLLAGMVALAAAFFAAWPVFDQLRLSRLQSNITTRDVLLKRLAGAEQRKLDCAHLVENITSDFEMAIRGGDPDSEPTIEPEWANQAGQTAFSVANQLEAFQRNLSDPHVVNSARTDLIAATKALQACLDLIPLPFTEPWKDSDLGMSDTEIENAKAAANKNAEQAEAELLDKIADVTRAGKVLHEAYNAVTTKLRTRLREIDDLVLDTAV